MQIHPHTHIYIYINIYIYIYIYYMCVNIMVRSSYSIPGDEITSSCSLNNVFLECEHGSMDCWRIFICGELCLGLHVHCDVIGVSVSLWRVRAFARGDAFSYNCGRLQRRRWTGKLLRNELRGLCFWLTS